MRYTIAVPFDVKSPGVVTEVRQVIDLKALDNSQFVRVLNAAKSGVVTGKRGYISQVVTELAEHIGVLPPFVVSSGSNPWTTGFTVAHPWVRDGSVVHDKIDELIRLSDTRHKMQCAANNTASAWLRDRKSSRERGSWMVGEHYLALTGWKSSTDMRKYLTEHFVKLPQMQEAMAKLREFIETRPTITVVTKEF